jgi:proteasome lid subunit RPN8/RPN11
LSKPSLTAYLTPGPERGGLILTTGEVIELANCSPDPEQGFMPDPLELLAHVDQAGATWHTHPDESANLSSEDFQTFILWPNLYHVIVGNDGTRWYAVKNGAVVNV